MRGEFLCEREGLLFWLHIIAGCVGHGRLYSWQQRCNRITTRCCCSLSFKLSSNDHRYQWPFVFVMVDGTIEMYWCKTLTILIMPAVFVLNTVEFMAVPHINDAWWWYSNSLWVAVGEEVLLPFTSLSFVQLDTNGSDVNCVSIV